MRNDLSPEHRACYESVCTTRANIAFTKPFWAALALRLRVVIDESIPTAGTDGRVLRVNPAFWSGLANQNERTAIVIHETAHCMLQHSWRRGSRDPMVWNIAADVHANSVVAQCNDATLPTGCITAEAIGMTAAEAAALPTEAIYDRIMSNVSKRPSCACALSDCGKPSGGDGDSDSDSDSAGPDAAQLSEEWKRATVAAATRARSAGRLPGVLASWSTELARVRVDWRALLARWLTQRVPSDYTWRRPSRRWASAGLYLPALDSEDAIGTLVIGADSSGSVGDDLLRSMLSESLASGRSVRAEHIRLALWDTRVYASHDVTNGDAPAWQVSRGGTDVRALFEWIEREGIEPSAVVVLTDMETPFPDVAPSYPVLWLCPEDSPAAPWGERIECF